MDKESNVRISPYKKVEIASGDEDEALKILFQIGLPFDHVGIGQYRITSDHCKVLSDKGIDYKHLD